MVKYGKDLACPETGLRLYLEKNMKVKHDYKNKSNMVTLDTTLKGS